MTTYDESELKTFKIIAVTVASVLLGFILMVAQCNRNDYDFRTEMAKDGYVRQPEGTWS